MCSFCLIKSLKTLTCTPSKNLLMCLIRPGWVQNKQHSALLEPGRDTGSNAPVLPLLSKSSRGPGSLLCTRKGCQKVVWTDHLSIHDEQSANCFSGIIWFKHMFMHLNGPHCQFVPSTTSSMSYDDYKSQNWQHKQQWRAGAGVCHSRQVVEHLHLASH